MMKMSPFSIVKSEINHASDVPETVQTVRKFGDTMRPILEAYERQWFLNIANYMGNQWVAFDRISKRFVVPQAPSWRVRLVVNKILPIARVQMAKLHEIKPSFYVGSRTSTQRDHASAKLSTKVVESMFHRSEFKNFTMDDIINFVVLTGNAHLFPAYDPSLGTKIRDRQLQPVLDPEGQFVLDPATGQPALQEVEKEFSTGDIVFDFVDPFELIPDFSSTSWEEQSANIKRKLRSVEYVQEKYGVKVKADVLDFSHQSPMKVMAQATSTGISSDIKNTLRHAVVVNDYYENPTDKYPEGRHIIEAGGKELWAGKLQTNRNGQYTIPRATFQGVRVPKRLIAMSPIENILPLQWQYNRGRSQLIEDQNLMSRPKLMAPMDSMADDVFTDQPGEIVFWDPASGERPFYLQPPNPSAILLQNLERLDNEMADIGGVHEISMGKLPRRATSGVALTVLEEKDTTIIGPMKESLKNGLEKAFSIALNLAAENFNETRVAKIVGAEGGQDQFKYSGADITSDDVRVLMDEPFPTSRAAKLEFALQLAQSGVISAQTARKILSLDGFTAVDDAIGDEEQARIAAEQQAARPPAGQQGGTKSKPSSSDSKKKKEGG